MPANTRNLSTLRRLVAGVTAALSTATSASAQTKPQVGMGPDDFADAALVTRLESDRPLADVARCWKRDGRFVPLFTRFSGRPPAAPVVYRLTEGGRLYERVTLTADAKGAAIAMIEISGRYDAGWTAMFERDRLEPLQRCLGPAANAAADARPETRQ